MTANDIKSAIRDVPDFPKPGIVFKDITPVLLNPALFRWCVDAFAERCRQAKAIKVAAIDARGFLFGGAVCDRLGIGLVPVRKKGKLPYKTFEASYDLEYGSNTVAVHQDAFAKGDRVVVLDDLLATGGTAAAATRLVEQAGGTVVEMQFLVELAFLNGREKLKKYPIFAPVRFG
jgi:adenine phosphoribosyltransferase